MTFKISRTTFMNVDEVGVYVVHKNDIIKIMDSIGILTLAVHKFQVPSSTIRITSVSVE